MNTQDLHEQAAHAAARYDGLLRRMDEITDLMISALAACDTDSALTLLDARSGVCEEISACSQSLDSLMDQLGRNEGRCERVVNDTDNIATGCSRRPDSRGTDLDALLRQLHANLTSLSEKQASCEALMASRLNECRSELMSLRQQRGLNHAYLPSRKAKKAVYLDSKR